METERTDTDDQECVDQQHLNKKVVNGDASAILDKTCAHFNGDCLDTKNSRGGSPLVNGGSDDIVGQSLGARNGDNDCSESESEEEKQTNGKTHSDDDDDDLLDEKTNVGGQKSCVDLIVESSSECILLDDNDSVNDVIANDATTENDSETCCKEGKMSEKRASVIDTYESSSQSCKEADKKTAVAVNDGHSAVQIVEVTSENGDSPSLDNMHVSDTSSKDIDTDYVISTDVIKLNDDSCSITNFDEGDSSNQDIKNLADSNSSRDLTIPNEGDSSKHVTTCYDGDSSKDVTFGDSSKDITTFDDGDSSKDVTSFDDGDSSRYTTNLKIGDSSKYVTTHDDGTSSKVVTNIEHGDTSKDTTNPDESNSSRKFTKLDKESGDGKSSRKFKKLDKGVSSRSRTNSKLDDGGCSDVIKGKSSDINSCDVVNLDDDDVSSNADVSQVVAVSEGKDSKQPALRIHTVNSSSVVTNKTLADTNKGEARKRSQKMPVTPSNSTIMMKDVTPVQSVTSVHSKPSHSNQGPQSLAAKGHPASTQLRPMSNLLYDLGLNLTKEQVYKDLIRIQSRKRTKNRLTEKEIQQLNKLKDAHKNLAKKNTRFHFPTISCSRCAFKTDSMNAMAYHNEFVETNESGDILCGLCDFKLHSTAQNDASKGVLDHIRQVHKRQPRIYTDLLPFTCAMCLFETNLKLVLGKHVRKCERNFKLSRNLEPGPADCDIPMKLPRYGAPTLSETLSRRPVGQTQHAPGTVGEHLRKRRENVTLNQTFQQGAYRSVSQSRPARPSVSVTSMQSLLGSTTAPLGSVPQQLVQVGGRLYNLISQNGQTLLTPITASQLPVISTLPRQMSITPQPRLPGVLGTIPLGAVGMPSRSSSAHTLTSNTSMTVKTPFSPENMMNVSDKNSAVAPGKTKSSSSLRVVPDFEICEICGGFVKDRDSLRIHFYYAHKVEIQRDVFLNKKGQLLCDLCAKHFWTYQGLVKHRQAEHKFLKEDSFHCFLCVKSGITDMVAHLNNCHGITQETLFRRTVCPCCGQHAVSPKSLENHMRLVHAEMFRRHDVQGTQLAAVQTHLSENTGHSEKPNTVPTCLKCNVLFETTAAFLKHCEQLHTFKCSRCQQMWSSLDFLQKHFKTVHGSQMEPCELCGESVVIGRPFIQHMKRKHLNAVTVSLSRLPDEKFNFKMGKRRKLASEAKNP